MILLMRRLSCGEEGSSAPFEALTESSCAVHTATLRQIESLLSHISPSESFYSPVPPQETSHSLERKEKVYFLLHLNQKYSEEELVFEVVPWGPSLATCGFWPNETSFMSIFKA